MNSPRLLLATITLVATSLFAQDRTITGAAPQAPNERFLPPSAMIRVDVEMVSVPFDKGLELLPNLRDPGSIDGAVSQIQKLIASGGATLIGWPELITKSGQRAVTEDIQEVRYAADFTTHHTSSFDSKSYEDTAVPQHAGAPVPTGFETRNAGITLEVEPVIGPDGATLDLNLVPQYVRLLDMPEVAAGFGQNGHPWRITQPRFFTAKTTTSVTLTSGHRMLLAQFRGPEGGNETLFFILKAEVVPVAAKAKEKPVVNQTVLSVKSDGTVILNQKAVPLPELQAKLKQLSDLFPDYAVIVRGDEQTPFRFIAAVLDTCRAANIWNVSFATAKPE